MKNIDCHRNSFHKRLKRIAAVKIMHCKYEIKQLVQQKPMLTLVTTESQYPYFVTVRYVVSISYVASRMLK